MLDWLSKKEGVELVPVGDVLHVGGLGALGLSLPALLGNEAQAAGKTLIRPSGGKAKSCILLFLMGGPPQHSTWDPKPEAPAEVRGEKAA